MENPTASAQVAERTEQLPLASQWQKGQLIGRGTFGSVYIASNQETGALCALKEFELLPVDPNSAECMSQLKQGIEVLSQLRHPNILQYYGSEIGSRLSISSSTLFGVCRDLKGVNLFVDASGIVKLADFGIAKRLTGQPAYRSLKKCLKWMAPELIQSLMANDNSADLDHTADIWSLGCTIVEMITGKPPWSEYERAQAIFKVMRSSPPIPETLSAEGKDFLHCCFRRQPAGRPSAAMLLEHALLRI
ncbi:mitogen-activated protein kinase kinase kinase 5-like [Syzygium oleosum]|uniref:mitogen-activated protein kinase kinase kinase 5-like n=1 Tax=Syzygium oleosum TaxID=219896 RepID=UPI0024BA55D0|nr:mitogen-activated protein kinase kinase kinase 5-like [Syzygium oleosum]